ncbi:MAG: hypothetical protein ACAH59_00035 [Pseudobdellovibrionaceae bacterium]
MKKAMIMMAGIFLAGSLSFAETAKEKSDTEVKTTTNPITGSETTTKKTKKKMKTASGEKSEMEVTDKTKKTKDGQVKQSVEVDADSTSNE